MRFLSFIAILTILLRASEIGNIKDEFRVALNRSEYNISSIGLKAPTKEELEKFRNNYKGLALIPKSAQKVIEEIESNRSKEQFEKEFSQFIEFLKKSGSDYSEDEISKFKEALKEALFPKKVPTFLYLFSTSMPPDTVRNVFSSLEKLKKRFPDVRFAGVIRGIELKGFGKKLGHFVDFRNPDFEVKVHPLIFEKLGVEKVPAFVYAECPEKFRFRQCEFEYVAFGDFSLKFFLELLNDENGVKFEKYYKYFVEGGK